MESRIRGYFADCNSGDVERIAAHFEPHAVHFFPPGTYEGPFRGAHTIGAKWSAAVKNLGSFWTVDQVLCDPRTRRAVIEWTHFKRVPGIVLRGDEWYVFSARGLIEGSAEQEGLGRIAKVVTFDVATLDQLKGAPKYANDDAFNWGDATRTRAINEYYGVPLVA